MDKPTRVEGLEGDVLRAPFASGSKSARVAVWLVTGENRWVLRRKNGPAMGDASLAVYVGQRVRCDGVIVAHTLLAESIEIIDNA
ncbi:MAG TPA: hypothetical protein VNG69_17190 [Casimicrobiaceae bacterium]|nr:hypothetical protein [Casimicrobiaceae bacterium]